jgi:hypothetical protein
MPHFLQEFSDPKLAKKITFLRGVSLTAGVLILVGIGLLVANGQMISRGSPFGGRFVSSGALKTVTWADSPVVYLIVASSYVLFGLLSLAAIYAALARLIVKSHGRPFIRRKYPY